MSAARDELAALLPPGVVVVAAADPATADPLHPDEAAVVAGAVGRRRAEFTLSRSCARTALRRLGAPDGPLLPGPGREPRWPAGVVGSITHCTGFCAAAVAWAGTAASVGIDAELDEPLPEGVDELVLLPPERAWIGTRPCDGTAWDRLVFSAKESIYKAWYPLTGRWLGFEDVVLHVDVVGGRFRAEPVAAPAAGDVDVGTFTGRYARSGGLLLTAVTSPPGPSRRRPHGLVDGY